METLIKDGYPVSVKMQKVWAVSLDILSHILDICERHNLRIWMDGGTLLGAVRHKGFIPWDDDIDMCMPRADYDKFCKIAPKELPEPYFLQTSLTEPGYMSGHAQVRNSNTSDFGNGEQYIGGNHGIPVDIFVLDYIPENGAIRFLQRTATMLLKKTVRAKFRPLSTQKKFGKKCLTIFSRGLYAIVPYKAAAKAYDKLFRCVDGKKAKRVGEISFRYSMRRFIYPKEVMDGTVMLDFEGLKLPAPADYDAILRNSYGPNYMTPAKEPTMHGVRYFDPERPYTEVAEYLRQNPEEFDHIEY